MGEGEVLSAMFVGFAGLRVLARPKQEWPRRPRFAERQAEGVEVANPDGSEPVVAARRQPPGVVPVDLLLRPSEDEDRGSVFRETESARASGLEP